MGSVYEDNEAKLLADFRLGIREAVARLFELYYEPLVYFTMQITGELEDAEDIVSNTFIKLMNKQRDFESVRNIKSFLYITAHNAAIDFLRYSWRNEKVQRELSYLSETFMHPNHDFLQVKTEVILAIRQEIESLPRQCREVFSQFFFQHRTTREIAEDLNIKDVTVRRQKQIALEMLRTALLKKQLLHGSAMLVFMALTDYEYLF